MIAATIGAWNAAMAKAPVAPPERLLGPGALLVLAPHPDDETLGASALLLEAARLGRRVGVVALTDGEASHRASRSYPPDRLAALRAEEQVAALAALGCSEAEVLRLRLPDGASGRNPRFSDVADEVAAFCDRLGVSAVTAPHPDDPHPDHHAAAELAARLHRLRPALRILFYEVWSRRLAPDEPFSNTGLSPFRVATDPKRKRRAIDCHRSQLGLVVADDAEGFAMPDWFLAAQEDPLERYSWLAMPGHVPEADHFSRLYANGGDPWHVRSSAYEANKRAATVEALGDATYDNALEAGCGEGFLSRALLRSGRVRQITGFDRETAIVERAAAIDSSSGARFAVGGMPDDMPAGSFDLVVLSEVLYFLDEAALAALAVELGARLIPGGHLLVVSYLGPTDTPLGGRESSDFLIACFGEALRPVNRVETKDYRIERLERRGEAREARAGSGEDRTSAVAPDATPG